MVDADGEAVKDVDGVAFSRKLTDEHPKVIASRLVREHYARRKKSVNGFSGPIAYQKTGWR